jgi:hypothetical protein
MSSGNANTTTQTITSLPPDYIKPQLEKVAGIAGGLFDQGVGPKYFDGSTVVPFSNQTNVALQGAETAALNNPLNSTAYGVAGDVMNRGGLTSGAANSLNIMGGIANGTNAINTGNLYSSLYNSMPSSGIASGSQQGLGVLGNIATGAKNVSSAGYGSLMNGLPQGGIASGANSYLSQILNAANGGMNAGTSGYSSLINGLPQNGLANGTAAPLSQMGNVASGATRIGTEGDYRAALANLGGASAAEQYLAPVARGDYLTGQGNPFFQQQLADQTNRLAQQINAQFSNAGRYGSGAQTDVLTKGLGELRTSALADQFARDQANQLAATGMIDSSRATLENQRQGLLSGITGVQGANVGNQYQAAQGLFGSLQGAQNQDVQNRLGALNSQSNVELQNIGNRLGAANTGANIYQGAQAQDTQARLAALGGQTGVDLQNLGAQAGAANSAANMYQQGLNQAFQSQLGAAQGLSGVQGANIANQGNIAQTMGNLYQNAQDQSLRTALQAPALAETRFNDYARLADIGAQYETKSTEALKDQIARFEFANMQPWNQLGLLSSAVQGVNAGGTQTAVTQRPDLPLGQRLLGGGALGAGIGNMIFPGAGGILGALGGGLLGGLS